jgi:hypothetical protein
MLPFAWQQHLFSYRIELPPRFVVQRPNNKALDNNLLELHSDDLEKLNVSYFDTPNLLLASARTCSFCAVIRRRSGAGKNVCMSLLSLTPLLLASFVNK